jgi:NAD(P)-dependent dehydrogenase (short-subunit alcohol dehydrogenase family)
MFDLHGRVVVVTGGNGGIGLGIAEALAQAGADLVVWGRDEAKNERAVAQLEAHGGRVLGLRCDVSDEQQVIDAMATSVAELGHVDSLVANAGVGGFTPFTQMSYAEWRRVQSVNLDGVFLSLREAARHLVERARVVRWWPSRRCRRSTAPRHAALRAGQGRVIAMMRPAVELARHRIRCNTILPGWTGTDLIGPMAANEKFVDATVGRTPVRRWGTPADMGPAAVFLVDPTHTFHTGDTIVVDGGYTIF